MSCFVKQIKSCEIFGDTINSRIFSFDISVKKVNANDKLTYQIKAYQSSYEKRNKTTAKYWADMGYSSEEASSQNGMDANVDIKTIEALASYLLTDAQDSLILIKSQKGASDSDYW